MSHTVVAELVPAIPPGALPCATSEAPPPAVRADDAVAAAAPPPAVMDEVRLREVIADVFGCEDLT